MDSELEVFSINVANMVSLVIRTAYHKMPAELFLIGCFLFQRFLLVSLTMQMSLAVIISQPTHAFEEIQNNRP